MSLTKLPKWNVSKTTFTVLCFYARKRANIWCQYIANLRGVWCDTFISICKQSLNINQLQMQAGPGSKQIPADTKLSYLHKDFHAEYRKVQHKGMIDERRSWCKNYGYLHHHFFYPEGRAIIGASSSSNMLTGYILFTQARPARAQAEILSPACMLWSLAAQCRFDTKTTWHFCYFFYFCYFASIYQYLAPSLH